MATATLICLGAALAAATGGRGAAAMDMASMMGGGSKPPEKVPANVADLPFIRCAVCEAYIKQAMLAVKALRAEEKPGAKVGRGCAPRSAIGCPGGGRAGGARSRPSRRCACPKGTAQQVRDTGRAAEHSAHLQLSEADIMDKLEKLCDVDSGEQGEWITRMDLQEDGDELKMVDMGEVREWRWCGRRAQRCHGAGVHRRRRRVPRRSPI